MKRIAFTLIALSLFLNPQGVSAAVLCSDGTPAPADNICNCASAASIGGSSFTPGSASGLTGNTYGNGGFQFSGVGGALMSCINLGSAICGAASSLFSSVSCSKEDKGGGAGEQKVPTNDEKNTKNTGKTAANEQKTTQREQCLNGAAYALAKTALQKLSDKTLNWIRTGFNGNPFYVRDIDSYLKTVENQKLDTYLNDYIPNSNPIFGNALRSVIKQQATGYSDGLLNKAMNTPQGKAYQDFQSDFTKGGWGAFLNPSNNPVGAYFNATDQLGDITGKAKQNIKDELLQGEGFLSMKKCVEYEAPKSNLSSTAPTQTQYGVPSGSGACSVIVSTNYATCCTSVGGSATNQTQCNAYSHGYQTGGTPAPVTSAPKCIRYETVTPGSLISNQLKGISNSSTELLINADSINEVLGTFFDQLMNRLFSEGVSGAGRGSTSTSKSIPGGLGTNVVTGSNGQTLASPASCQTPLGYNASTGGFNDEFDISRPQQLKAIIETQRSYVTRSQDAQFKMREVIPKLGQLDYCVPGPNATRNEGLIENAQTFISQIQQVREKEHNWLVTANKILDPSGALCGIFGDVSSNCSNGENIVGYATSQISLYDKVDGNQRKISDRGYKSDIEEKYIHDFFANTAELLKSRFSYLYTDDKIINAFTTQAFTQPEKDFVGGQIKDAIKESSSMLGYAQGIAAYNDQYNTNIQSTQQALVELEDIYQQIVGIVGPAKAKYIYDHNQPGQTPIKLSCINNAYQIGPLGPGLPHLENITAAPDDAILQSATAGAYFYSNL